MKGEFTDRKQAPAPISNQTVPSGEPCGAHICGHSITAWHHTVLQESSTPPECSTLSERWVMSFNIRQRVYECWQNMSSFLLCSSWVQVVKGAEGRVFCRLAFFEDSHSSRLSFLLPKSLSESLFVTLLSSSLYPTTQYRCCIHVCMHFNEYMRVCECFTWTKCVWKCHQKNESYFLYQKQTQTV